ncbi:GATA transcription factor 15-like [Typha angustifolia]|uniref:GATA transcription factor 15-like n=1 Tax=Typha angustifolia TaxID=59011 RepID=UPI003C2F7F53
MLQQCSNHSNGFLYGTSGSGSNCSILFPISGKQSIDEAYPSDDTYDSITSFSSSVDCTLSLGTPSTRQADTTNPKSSAPIQRPSYVSTLCWDIISQSNKHQTTVSKGSTSSNSTSGANLGRDSLLFARRCANCDTTSTPLWRNGPRGPKSLCNACGIRYKKEERRAAAATASPSSTSSVVTVAEGGIGYGYQRTQQQHWGCYQSGRAKGAPISMYGDDAMDDGDVSYHPWRLNFVPPQPVPVQERPGLFQYN